MNDFQKFAISNNVNSNTLDSYSKAVNSIISPTIIEERQMNAVTIDVFSALIRERIIFLGTGINDDVANIVNSQLMYLNSLDQETPVKMFINSPGGSVYDGLAIYDVMNWVNCGVETYVMGMAASMGAVLASSGMRDHRFALKNSRIMIHQPMMGIPPGTQESDIAIAYNELRKDKELLLGILAENSGKSIEELREDADRDHWLSPSEALPGVYGEFGLIDEIITKKNK
jgi:ATP-dependent Clp protease protease subunit